MIRNVINSIGMSYKQMSSIYSVIGSVITVMGFYKSIYYIIGFFFTRKFKKAKNKHKYAIVIAARNEEKVIGNLLDSIKKQDYPKDLITTFVVADNCDDNTKNIAIKHDAICYERNDLSKRTKGYALQYLFKKIDEDYGINSFEGYFVFDADNLLKKNFVSKMNDAFDSGQKIITSYRNTKNFDENWIASTYAIHWLRSIRANHRARSVLHLATNIQGTGFLIANEIVKDGWNYTSLTEDRALTADAVAKGYEITYQDSAEFFDEQPVKLKVALKQRLRWSRGHLLAFIETGPQLFKNIFVGPKKNKTKETKKSKIIESIRYRFASYDTLMQLLPLSVFNLFRWILVYIMIYGCYSYTNGITNKALFSTSTWLGKLLRIIFNNPKISIEPGINALLVSILITIWLRVLYRIGIYFVNTWNAIYVFILERKRIKKISFWKKTLYILTWPIFDVIGRYTTLIAIFKKVEWVPTPHESKVTVDEVDNG